MSEGFFVCPAGGSSRSRDAAGVALAAAVQHSHRSVHTSNSQPCLQVFKADLLVLNILLYYHDKEVSRTVY